MVHGADGLLGQHARLLLHAEVEEVVKEHLPVGPSHVRSDAISYLHSKGEGGRPGAGVGAPSGTATGMSTAEVAVVTPRLVDAKASTSTHLLEQPAGASAVSCCAAGLEAARAQLGHVECGGQVIWDRGGQGMESERARCDLTCGLPLPLLVQGPEDKSRGCSDEDVVKCVLWPVLCWQGFA